MSAINLTPTTSGWSTPAEGALVALTTHAGRTRSIRTKGDEELTRAAETLCRVLGRRAVRSGADALTVALVLDHAGIESPVPFALADTETPIPYEVAS